MAKYPALVGPGSGLRPKIPKSQNPNPNSKVAPELAAMSSLHQILGHRFLLALNNNPSSSSSSFARFRHHHRPITNPLFSALYSHTSPLSSTSTQGNQSSLPCNYPPLHALILVINCSTTQVNKEEEEEEEQRQEEENQGVIDVNPPRGTRDFPPEEMRIRNWLFHNFREVPSS